MDTYKNITIVNPFDQENETWATCYIKEDGDDQNVLKLDTKQFIVVKKGKSRIFNNQDIQGVYKGNKRLLLPLIIGGIIAPMSLIAIYENAYPPFLLLSVFFFGIFLVYTGWAGSNTMVLVFSEGKEEYIFFRTFPKQVLKFIDFLNLYVSTMNQSSKKLDFYHVYTPEAHETQQDFSTIKDQGYVLLTSREFEEYSEKSKSGFDVIKIDPQKLKHPIRWSTFPDGSSFFTVKSINPECILSADF